MSLSILVRDHSESHPERAESWEKVFLELQVVLAYCDGVLAPAERMTLSLLSLAKRDERENRRLVDRLIRSIESDGLNQAAERVVADIKALLGREEQDARGALADEILRESIAIVVADDVISDNERAFVTDRLAPGLGLDPKQAHALLQKASGRLSRSHAYVERAYECYMMLSELDNGPPRLNTPEGDELPGFLGAVDKFVVDNQVGSSRVVAYYLGALGGIFWVDAYKEHIAVLGQLTRAARELRKTAGVDGRLRAIHHELGQLRNRGVDAHGFQAVTRHVTNTLGKMHGLNEAQRDLFKNQIAPALEIDHEALLQSAAQRRSMIDLHRNLTGIRETKDAEAQSQKWWQFWK